MAKTIDSDSAAYPASNTSELRAVNTFKALIDLSRVKPFITELDKVPNIDGHIDIVTEKQVSIGKLEVQIKTLDKKNVLKPKYQCSKEFLAYCQDNIPPVLLVVVNSDAQIAYWHHIDRALISVLSKKIKKESVNLDFDVNNCISTIKKDYIEKWIAILKERKEQIFAYETLNNTKQKLERELEEVKEYIKYSVGKKDPVYAEIHTFLDYYNGLLDNEFNTIKKILYPDYWKIGLGYGTYEQKEVSFMLFPILYDVNDVLIKKFNPDHIFVMNGALKVIGHNGDNPIKTKPEKYAYELIKGDITKALIDQPLVVKNTFLAKEYIFAFIDRFHYIMGLKANEQMYSIFDIEYAIYRFLPFFIGESIYMPEKLKGSPFSFDIDNFYYHQSGSSIKAVELAKKRLKKNPSLAIPHIYLISKDFNIDVLLRLIGFLHIEKITEIKREYDSKNITITDRIYFNWEAWSNVSIMKNLTLFHQNFPVIYDSIISTYFPKLFNDLKYYKGFNLVIAVVDFTLKSEMEGIRIDYYYLQSEKTAENKFVIYDANTPGVPISRNATGLIHENGLIFGGNNYKLKYRTLSSLKSIFDKTPILTAVRKLLDERFKEYFKKKEESN